MPQRKARSGRQKSARKTKGARPAGQAIDTNSELEASAVLTGAATGVEYPVPRLAWSLRPS
jgi:hypothetical protein